MHRTQAKHVQLGNCLKGLPNVPYYTPLRHAIGVTTAACTHLRPPAVPNTVIACCNKKLQRMPPAGKE